ncbi:hypothetical protein [Streptomyces sp. Tu 2975]|uniref:hypothetical protein n=1 Tax=Streptomyces sp. Tu 2975 TaxID=2676871 RepID=UPI003267004E
MTTAQHLAAIDRLRCREFPAQRGRSEFGDSGPGYHLAELRTPADGLEAVERADGRSREPYEAECEALVVALSSRWGRASGSLCGRCSLGRSAESRSLSRGAS